MTDRYVEYMTEKMMFLSKEELIWLLLQYRETEVLVSETLVEESKYHLTPEDALEQIREFLNKNKADFINYAHKPERIQAEVSYYMGKISHDELRKRLGFED